MIKYIVVGLLVFLVYMVFVGSLSLYTVLTGLLVSFILSAVSAKYLVVDEKKLLDAGRLLYMVYYFFKYITIIEIKAHMDVVKRIINMDINPGIVKVPVNVKSRYARLLVMGSITNTPGTVVVDERNDYFYVNWISVTTKEPVKARKEISEEFEYYAYKIFE
ncbi:MAG: Na+/H+ antiporter subunit E [Desulfurococcaceae archaeon]